MRRPDGGVAVAAPAPVLDQRGTRRAPRTAIVEGAEISHRRQALRADRSVDRRRAGAVGGRAQAEPARARLDGGREADAALSGDDRLGGFEMPEGGAAPRYRAGMAFSGADADGISDYATRHRRPGDRSQRTTSDIQSSRFIRRIVSSRSEPVETIAAGAPVTSSSRAM